MNDNEGVNKSFDSVGNEKLINEFSGLRSNIDKNTEGSLGVMLDDILAGIYTIIILIIIFFFIGG